MHALWKVKIHTFAENKLLLYNVMNWPALSHDASRNVFLYLLNVQNKFIFVYWAVIYFASFYCYMCVFYKLKHFVFLCTKHKKEWSYWSQSQLCINSFELQWNAVHWTEGSRWINKQQLESQWLKLLRNIEHRSRKWYHSMS